MLEEREENNGFLLFSYISLLPKRLENFVSKNFENYLIDFSNTTQSFYYINHCDTCSASLGDFYMYSEPDGAFFPMSENVAKQIELVELKESGFVKLNANCSYISPSLIETCAQRKKYKPQ